MKWKRNRRKCNNLSKRPTSGLAKRKSKSMKQVVDSRCKRYAKPICIHCGSYGVLYDVKVFFNNKNNGDGFIYVCPTCPDSRVTCRSGSRIPLGTMANKDTRIARSKAHDVFDPYWQKMGIARSSAYETLARMLGIERHQCHFGLFDEAMCNRVIEMLKEVENRGG